MTDHESQLLLDDPDLSAPVEPPTMQIVSGQPPAVDEDEAYLDAVAADGPPPEQESPRPGPAEQEPPPDEQQGTEQAAPKSLLGGLRSGQWLDRQDFPPMRWVVPGVIPEGTTVLAGAPKTGKSWVAFGLALGLTLGTRVFGSISVGSPRPVLYLALEDGWRRLQGRARALLGDGVSIPRRIDLMITVEFGRAVDAVAEWLDLHRDENPVVVIDTLAKVMPRAQSGESAYERDYRAVGAYTRLIGDYPGASVIIVHHTRKMGSEDFIDGVSGTLGITGAADTTVVLTRGRVDNDGLLKVTGRDVVEAEYAVRIDNGRWTLKGDSLDDAKDAAEAVRATAGLGDRSADIVEMARAAGAVGIRASDVVSKLGIAGKDASQYLGRLTRADRLARAGRGLYVIPDTTHTTHTTAPPAEGDEYDTDPHENSVVSVVSVVSNGVCPRCRRQPASPTDPLGWCRACADRSTDRDPRDDTREDYAQ